MTAKRKYELRAPIVNPANEVLYRTHPARDITPQKLAAILNEMESGWCQSAMSFFDEMEEKDLHLATVMQTRIIAAASTQRRIVAASDKKEDKMAADFVRDVWESLEGRTRILQDLLSAIGRGFAVAEMILEVSEGYLVARGVNFCPPTLFTFADPLKPGMLLDFPRYLEPGDSRGVELPRDKFIFHAHRAFGGGPLRSGLYRGLSWYYLFTSMSVKDWMSFMDIYGIPLRLGRFKPTADEQSRAVLKRAVNDLGADAAAIISDDTTIEFVESKLSGNHSLFENAVEYFNRQKSKRVLGQTLTTEQGSSGSYALGEVHDRVRRDIMRLDCLMLDETLTRDFLVPLVKANFGVRKRYPRFESDTETIVERKSRLEDIKTLFAMKAPLAVSQLYNAAGIPEPAPGDAIVQNVFKEKPRMDGVEKMEKVDAK